MSARGVSHLLELPLQDGGSVHVEVLGDEPVVDGLVPAARGQALATAAAAELSFEQALDRIRPAADALIGRLRTLATRPDEVEVSFGLRMSAKAGAVIAVSGAEANFTVALRWTRD
jgi:hypothetical protein